MRLKSCTLAVALLLTLLPILPAQAAYVISLKNGETITAESYRLDKGKVYLKYPVGEAAIDLSSVADIKLTGQCPELFTEQAAPRTVEAAQAGPASTEKGGPTAQAPDKNPTVNAPAAPAPDADGEEPVAALEPDPLAGQMDRFVNGYFSADPQSRAALDKKMGGVFQTFFGEDAPVDETADY